MNLLARTLHRWFSSRPATARRYPRRRQLAVEVLEDRCLFSVAPIAVNVHGIADSLAIGGTLFFSTAAGELWKTDGTPAGTALVKDLAPDDHLAFYTIGPRQFTDVNGTLFFTFAVPNSYDGQLWKSDGTDAGTVLVKDFGPGINAGTYPDQLTAVNGTLFFTTFDRVNGNDLWKSDGTEAGTVVVKEFDPTYDFLNDRAVLTSVNGKLFFATRDFGTGARLWTSDGTEAGTIVLATDANEAGGLPSMTSLTSFQGELFFVTNDPTQGPALWKSDGTVAGTRLVSAFNQPDNVAAWAGGLTDVNGSLYFLYTNFVSGDASLWKSDGIAAGTTPVKHIDVGPGGDSSPDLRVVNDTIFFATHSVRGDDLWKSDGTEAGTILVKEFPAFYGSLFQGMTAANGLLYFGATDYVSGPTLWQSDGTAAGTIPVRPTERSENIGAPANDVLLNGKLLFFADNDAGWQPQSGEIITDFALVAGYNQDSIGLKLWSVSPDKSPPADPVDLSVLDPKPIDDTEPVVYWFPITASSGRATSSPATPASPVSIPVLSPPPPGAPAADVAPITASSGTPASSPATPTPQATAPISGINRPPAPLSPTSPVLPSAAVEGSIPFTPAQVIGPSGVNLAQNNTLQTANPGGLSRSAPMIGGQVQGILSGPSTVRVQDSGGGVRSDDTATTPVGDDSDSFELLLANTPFDGDGLDDYTVG